MNDEHTTVFNLDPRNPPKPDWSRFDAMSEAERYAAALADPDCPPATEEELEAASRIPSTAEIRRRLALTQAEFARSFGLSLGAVRDWEQGVHTPDHAARTLLRVIALNPEAVRQAVTASRPDLL